MASIVQENFLKKSVSYPSKSKSPNPSLGDKSVYKFTPPLIATLPKHKGIQVNKLNMLERKSLLYYKLRVFGFYLLTSLSERKNPSANSYSPVLIHFLPLFYLYLSLLLTPHSQAKKFPNLSSTKKMTSNTKVHPSTTPSSSSPNPGPPVRLLPPLRRSQPSQPLYPRATH